MLLLTRIHWIKNACVSQKAAVHAVRLLCCLSLSSHLLAFNLKKAIRRAEAKLIGTGQCLTDSEGAVRVGWTGQCLIDSDGAVRVGWKVQCLIDSDDAGRMDQSV
jgi:hypothetical protein